MQAQHFADPDRGAREFAINAGMERDGLRHRVCLHADRTLLATEDGVILECDYCPTARIVAPGLATGLPAWYWTAAPPTH